MAVRNLEAVQQLSGSAVSAETRAGRIGLINLGAKRTGERGAGNPHATFDVAGTGNVAWSRCCDTRRRKGETTGNTNIDLNRRASPRPYRMTPAAPSNLPMASTGNGRAKAICPAMSVDRAPAINSTARHHQRRRANGKT